MVILTIFSPELFWMFQELGTWDFVIEVYNPFALVSNLINFSSEVSLHKLHEVQSACELCNISNTVKVLRLACQKLTMLIVWTVQEELESLLNDSGHLQTLAFLYSSKGMTSKALSIWRLLAKNYSSGFWKSPAGSNDLQDASIVTCSWETAVKEASKILEESSDQNLVLQHLGWVCGASLACLDSILYVSTCL